jgi:hypothetical protein
MLWATNRADAYGPAGGQQVVGALRAQAVGRAGEALGVPQVRLARQRGELVDDHLGLGLGHDPGDRVGIEGVGHDWPGAEGLEHAGLGRRPGHADHLVTGGGELGDELGADRTRGSGDEHLHGGLLHDPRFGRSPGGSPLATT